MKYESTRLLIRGRVVLLHLIYFHLPLSLFLSPSLAFLFIAFWPFGDGGVGGGGHLRSMPPLYTPLFLSAGIHSIGHQGWLAARKHSVEHWHHVSRGSAHPDVSTRPTCFYFINMFFRHLPVSFSAIRRTRCPRLGDGKQGCVITMEYFRIVINTIWTYSSLPTRCALWNATRDVIRMNRDHDSNLLQTKLIRTREKVQSGNTAQFYFNKYIPQNIYAEMQKTCRITDSHDRLKRVTQKTRRMILDEKSKYPVRIKKKNSKYRFYVRFFKL